jgi:hypothetical protein
MIHIIHIVGALPQFYNIILCPLRMLHYCTEMLFQEFQDRKAALTPILFPLLGMLITYFLQLSISASSRGARVTITGRKFEQINVDRCGTLLIVFAVDEYYETATECIAHLIHEISLSHKSSSSFRTKYDDSPIKRRSSFPDSKRPRPYPGYYRDLLKGKGNKENYQSE